MIHRGSLASRSPAARRSAPLDVIACTRGSAAVEFAIVSGVLIMLLIGILDLGRALWVQNQISFLADQAVRRVLIDSEVSGAELEAELRDEFTAGDPRALSIEVVSEVADGTTYRVVSVEFPFAVLIPNLADRSISLGVTRRVPAD